MKPTAIADFNALVKMKPTLKKMKPIVVANLNIRTEMKPARVAGLNAFVKMNAIL